MSHHRSGMCTCSDLAKTKLIRLTSTCMNQTGCMLVDLPEDGIANEWVKSSKAQRPALIISPCANGTRGSCSGSHQSAPPLPRHGLMHVPCWTTILHPTLAYALSASHLASFGKLLILLAYAAIMIYMPLQDSNPFADSLRTGYIAISQIPITVACGGADTITLVLLRQFRMHSLYCLFLGCSCRWWQWHFICHVRL
jgi:hypothetical protein